MDSPRPRGVILTPILRQQPLRVFTEKECAVFREKYSEVEWYFLDEHPKRTINGKEHLDTPALAGEYQRLIEENNIDVVLGGTHDDGAVLIAHLAEVIPRVKGPSMRSVLQGNLKSLAREHLIPDSYNLKYCSVPLSQPDVPHIISTVGLPLILKPNSGSGSTLIKVCHTIDEVTQALEVYQKEASLMQTYDISFGRLLGDCYQEYESLLIEQHLIAEEYIENSSGCISTHTVEFLVQNGQIKLWGYQDNIYWKDNPAVVVGFGFPTLLPKVRTDEAELMSREIIQNAINHGFNDHFYSVEFWVFEDGSMKVMEVNPRLCYQLNEIYETVMDGGNALRALINIQLGNDVKVPILKSVTNSSIPCYGLNGYINTTSVGISNDLFNYELAQQMSKGSGESWFWECIPKDKYVDAVQDSGSVFSIISLVGFDFMDCKEQLKVLREKLLGEQHLVCWEDDFNWTQTMEKIVSNQKETEDDSEPKMALKRTN